MFDMISEKRRAEVGKNSDPWTQACCQLYLGEYDWATYERRAETFPILYEWRSRFPAPYWNGEDLTGKSIILWTEQGAGDMIQFIRYAHFLKGAKLHFETMPWLHTLMKEHVDEIYDTTQIIPGTDYQCSLMSLPYLLSRDGVVSPDPSEIGTEFPYFHPAGDFDIPPGYNIGICWAGDQKHPYDSTRSCPLKYFRVFDRPGVNLYSFQTNPAVPKVWDGMVVHLMDEACVGMRLKDLSPRLTDFRQTALAMRKMDLIISVDTAVAHLAGAMNVPCWVLIGSMSDWRWTLLGDGTVSNWYPSVRVARWQGDWADTIRPVADYVRSISTSLR